MSERWGGGMPDEEPGRPPAPGSPTGWSPGGPTPPSPAPPPAAPPPPPPSQPLPPGSPQQGWGAAGPATGEPVTWASPRTGGKGCLRACLVVGAIGVGVLVIGIVALIVLGGRLAEEIAENPDAVLGAPCQIASSIEVAEAVGQPVELFELEGVMGGMMDALLDKRLLAEAPDCYGIGDDGFLARIAVLDDGGAASFAEARALAQDTFLLSEEVDIGDEAFCTTISDAGSSGVLVRFDDRVVYVSLIERSAFDPEPACGLAKEVARTLAR